MNRFKRVGKHRAFGDNYLIIGHSIYANEHNNDEVFMCCGRYGNYYVEDPTEYLGDLLTFVTSDDAHEYIRRG